MLQGVFVIKLCQLYKFKMLVLELFVLLLVVENTPF